MISRFANLMLALSAFLALAVPALAQSTIFNIPSTDVVAKKRVYLEFDLISHLESHDQGGFQAYVPRAVVGLGRSVEIGVNLCFTDALAPGQPIEMQPNLKWQFYQNEERGVAASFGGIAYLPVAYRAGADSFGFIYSAVSKKIKTDYGPRLTGGAYILAGRARGNGAEGGAIAGYEQPLHRRVSFVADWLSGHNRFGYVTPGLSFSLPKNSLLNIGYSIGNQGRKNNGLFVYLGITL
jgi:hypothetical protein